MVWDASKLINQWAPTKGDSLQLGNTQHLAKIDYDPAGLMNRCAAKTLTLNEWVTRMHSSIRVNMGPIQWDMRRRVAYARASTKGRFMQ